MKKNKIIKIVFISLIMSMILTSNTLYAALGGTLDTSIYDSVTAENPTELDDTISKILGSVITILQIAAMAGVVITGVKYMYAGSEDKGKIKQTLIWLVIGAIFVFAAPKIVEFITTASNAIF